MYILFYTETINDYFILSGVFLIHCNYANKCSFITYKGMKNELKSNKL